jgi:hypothetical protein
MALLLYLWEQTKAQILEPQDIFFISLFITSFILSAILAAVSGINWMPRHSFFVYLPVCIFLPRLLTLSQINTSTLRKLLWKRALPIFALTGLVFLNVISSTNYFFNEDYWRDDYRSAAQYLVQNRQPEDISILLWGSPRLMAYYGDSATLDGRGIKADELSQEVDRLTNQAEVVFVAVNREFLWHRSSNSGKASPAEVLSESYDLKDAAKFINFVVYKLERRSI